MFKNIVNSFFVFYSPRFPALITYMLQTSEYNIKDYLLWFYRTKDFSKVQRRGRLEQTKIAVLILKTLNFGILLQLLVGLVFIYLDITGKLIGGWGLGLGLIILYPVLWSHLICLPVFLARELYIRPRQNKQIIESQKIFNKSKALKIVIAGSYGKTTMKELLFSVLSPYKKVGATPANKNVASSHAIFAKNLKGDEEILIIELGEGSPGDVYKFANTIHPDMAIITGLAPAHLDKYKSLQSVAKDIFSLSEFVPANKLFVNGESAYIGDYINKKTNLYKQSGALGFHSSDIKSGLEGIKFDLSNNKIKLHLSTKLLGEHQIGPISLVATLALKLGINVTDVQEAIKNTSAYEHRMQPYKLNGATIIDDSYNGNIEGIRAGTELLRSLKADRKIYITPGLVDQGSENKKIHIKLGQYIAKSDASKVILMKNSLTKYIKEGLKKADYKGKVEIETDPLSYFNNLGNYVANGDIVMIQNDWTDNYI